MEIKLLRLKLENFKGIENLEINFNENTSITGANATGKTTIFDAYSWLLWDKDSLNRKSFNIKPFYENGEEKHGLETKVSGTLLFDDTEVEIAKVFKEIWTKKRGQTQEVFSGHTTDYFINDVPIKKAEYNERIESAINEKEFNLLSNPAYFSSILDKKERRDVLLSLIKDVNKEDVIKQFDDLKELELDKYSIDEIKAMAKSSSKKINDELKSLPARIDELEKSKTTYSFEEIEVNKKSIEKKIDDIDVLISKSADSSNIITEKNIEIQKLLDEKRKIKDDIDQKNNDKKDEVNKKYSEKLAEFTNKKNETQLNLSNAKIQLQRLNLEKEDCEKSIVKENEKLDKFRKEWVEENNRTFDGSLQCPVCKSEYSEDKKAKILDNFNLDKSKKLTELQKLAENSKKVIEKANKTIESFNKNINLQEEIIQALENSLNQMQFNEEKENITLEEYPSRYFEIDIEVENIQKELSNLSTNDNSELLNSKSRLKTELEEIISKLALKDHNKHIDEKIKLYMDQEKEFAKSYENQQRKIYLCDEYVRIYTSLVQNKINSLFKEVNFKLFDTQVNGGIIETCEVTVNGVPYSDVNNAGKINAGLDVINTLSKHLEKKVPIFVDNAESVNKLLDVESQIVKLYVGKNKTLKVEGE